jgi:hypothetical protein
MLQKKLKKVLHAGAASVASAAASQHLLEV